MSCLLAFAPVLLFAPLIAGSSSSDGFLTGHRRGAAHQTLTSEDFAAAVSTVMGCGGATDNRRLAEIEAAVLPIWRAVPKNEQGLVEWRMLRYTAHRYFMKHYSLLIRGFEPMRQINTSNIGSAAIFSSEHMPSALDDALTDRRSSQGFSLNDLVGVLATLEQLISDAEAALLDQVYSYIGPSSRETIDGIELREILEAYMVHWMMDNDGAMSKRMLTNRSMLNEVIPQWSEISGLLDGLVSSLHFRRRVTLQPRRGNVAMSGRYTFDDVHELVGAITKTFASFWEGECQLIKESLVEMDDKKTGRVRLADFYAANMKGEWHFSESESYLRELGALDESSSRGKQVIIPNYLQAASNCIVATPHYLVCCVNECEAIQNEIEDVVGTPLAGVRTILEWVGNTTGFDDSTLQLSGKLKTQLSRIAAAHGGVVPLHGRLFAQWLHYVFPQDCPYPHKSGAVSSQTPAQFGESSVVTVEELASHVASHNASSLLAEHDDAHWMAQWTEEEELLVDTLHFRPPWESNSRWLRTTLMIAACSIAAVGLWAKWHMLQDYGADSKTEGKAHLV